MAKGKNIAPQKMCYVKMNGLYICSFHTDSAQVYRTPHVEEAIKFTPSALSSFCYLFGIDEKSLIKEEITTVEYRELIHYCDLYKDLTFGVPETGSFDAKARGKLHAIYISDKLLQVGINIGNGLDEKPVIVIANVKKDCEKSIRTMEIGDPIVVHGTAYPGKSIMLECNLVVVRKVPKQSEVS